MSDNARRGLGALLTVIAFAALLALSFILWPQPAPAAETGGCPSWEAKRDGLAKQFGETPAFIATLDANQGNGVLVVLVNPVTKSFTLVVEPNGSQACTVASGQGWEPAPAAVAAPPGQPPEPKMQRWQNGEGQSIFLLPIGASAD